MGFFDSGSFDLGSGSSDSWYSSDSWSADYDDAFTLSGTTNDDPSWWSTITDFASSKTGANAIAGAASGALNYLSSNRATEASKASLKDKQATLAAHNASIAVPFTGAKKAIFNGKS